MICAPWSCISTSKEQQIHNDAYFTRCGVPSSLQVSLHAKARTSPSPGQAAAVILGLARAHHAALEYLDLVSEQAAGTRHHNGSVAAGSEGVGMDGSAAAGLRRRAMGTSELGGQVESEARRRLERAAVWLYGPG